MADASDLNDDENWSGGFYELAVEIGPRDDLRLEQTLLAVWRHASVRGCMAVAEYRPLQHADVPLSLQSLDKNGHLRGLVRLPSASTSVCGVVAVREEDGSDWLDFYLPLGALARTDSAIGSFPFGDDGSERSFAWRRPLDGWLTDIGSRVYEDVQFRVGLVGFEVLGELRAQELVGGVPGERFYGLLVPTNTKLEYHEANHRGPMATIGMQRDSTPDSGNSSADGPRI